MNWKYGKASVAGTSHAVSNTPCQDAHVCLMVKDVLIAVVCDGAGSALKSEMGSKTISQYFASQIELYLLDENDPDMISEGVLINWVINAREHLKAMSLDDNVELSDYACTFLAAIVSKNTSYFMQIGDGCMVVAEKDTPDDYMWIFWPQKGMYFNTTNFITDNDFLANLQIERSEKKLGKIAVFSDGIESIALKYDTSEAFGPFFKGLFGALNSQEDTNLLNDDIAAFLNSPKVNERTDDDKTLILASFVEE